MENIIQNTDDKVWVTISRTINLGNYESIKIDAGMSQTIPKKGSAGILLEDVSDAVFGIVKAKSKEYKRELKRKTPTNYDRPDYDNCDQN